MRIQVENLSVEGARAVRNLGPVVADIAAHVVRANNVQGVIVVAVNEGVADIGSGGPAFDARNNAERNLKAHRVLADIVLAFQNSTGIRLIEVAEDRTLKVVGVL